MTYGGMQARPESTSLTDRAARYLEKGPADVVDLIGHICNLPAAPRIVAEHMARAMFSGRPEFVLDTTGRWSLCATAEIIDVGAGERTYYAPGRKPRPRARGRSPGRSSAYSDFNPALPPTPLADLSWAVVDVETTGGRLPSDRITEVAAVIVHGGKVTEVFETLVNPERSIPRMITQLTNISWEMVKDAPVFSAIVPALVQKLEGCVFVAHNVQFDWKFVSHEVSRASGTQLFGRRLCTVRLARKLLPHLPRRSLDHVANYYGVEINGRHRAGGDAIATAHCLIRMLDEATDRGCITWEDLDYMLGARASRKKKRRSALPTSIRRDTTA